VKILHVIPSVSPFRGGPSSVLQTFVQELSRQGVEVHVCSTDDDGPGRLNVVLAQPQLMHGGIYWHFARQLRFYTVSLPLERWLRRHIADYDLVHIHALFSFPSTMAAAISKKSRVPYVIRPLGVLNQWGMRNRRPWLKQASLNLIEMNLIRGAALLHYTSEAEREQAELAGVQAPSIVLPNPIQLISVSDVKGAFRRQYPGLAQKKILLFLSRIDRKKGLELLLNSFAGLSPAQRGFHLVIAGTGDSGYIDTLKARAQSLGVAAHITWTGLLSGDLKRATLADADLFLLPSYSENFGNAAAEALAAGLPVIISENVGIHREVASAEAGLVVPCDPVQLRGAIERFFVTPGLPAKLSAAATALATTAFSSPAVIGRLIACYEDLLRMAVPSTKLVDPSPARC
jgi:glycosyltransferase involved in cell wall biosynthesis